MPRNYRVLWSRAGHRGRATALDTIGNVILPQRPQKRKSLQHDIAWNKKFVPVPVAENRSWDDSPLNPHLGPTAGHPSALVARPRIPFPGKENGHHAGLCALLSAPGHDMTTTP